MSKQFQIYPRGFVGARLRSRITRSSGSSEITVAAVQNTFQITKAEDETIQGHPDIDRLWKRYLSEPILHINFDFRQECVKAALDAFGTKSFSDWVSAQRSSPAFGDLHEDFIDDLMRFALKGQRDTDLAVWANILNYRDVDAHANKTPSDVYVELHGAYQIGGAQTDTSDGQMPMAPELRNISTTSFLAQWHSRENGFDDMMRTMHILFGTVY